MSLIHKFPNIILPIQNTFDENSLNGFFQSYIEDINLQSSELIWYKYNYEDINHKEIYEEKLFNSFEKYILKIKSKIKIKKIELIEFLDIVKNLIFKIHKIETLLNKPNTDVIYNYFFVKKKDVNKDNFSELISFSGKFYNTILFTFFIEETWIDELVEKSISNETEGVFNILQLYFKFFSNIIYSTEDYDTYKILNVWFQYFMTKIFTFKQNLCEFHESSSSNTNIYIKINKLNYYINNFISLKKIFNIEYKYNIFKDINITLLKLHNEIMENNNKIIYHYLKSLENKLKYIINEENFDNFLIKISLKVDEDITSKFEIYNFLFAMFRYKKTSIYSSLQKYIKDLDLKNIEIKNCIYDYTINLIKNKNYTSADIFFDSIFYDNEEFSQYFLENVKFDLLYNQKKINLKSGSFELFINGLCDKTLKDKILTIFRDIKNKKSKNKINFFFLTQNYWNAYINTGYIKYTDELFADLDKNININSYDKDKNHINYFHPHVGNININLKFANRIVNVEMLPAHYFYMNGKNIFENYDTKFKETIKNNLVKSCIWDTNCKLNTDETLFVSDKIDLIKLFKQESFKEDFVEKIVNENILFTKEQVIMANISNILKGNKLNYNSIYASLTKSINKFDIDEDLFNKVLDTMMNRDYIKLDNDEFTKLY
jgi:hypothetical protein